MTGKKIDKYIISVSDLLETQADGRIYRGYYDQIHFPNDYTKPLAIKEFPMQKMTEGKPNLVRKAVIDKLKLLKPLKHPHLQKVVDFKQTENNLYLVMDFFENSLYNVIQSKAGQITEEEVLQYFGQIIDAFRCLRTKGYTHLNIYPQSIYFAEDVCKVGNFSFDREYQIENEINQTPYTLPLFQDPCITLDGVKGINEKSDIYSLGAVLYWMLYYNPNYQNEEYPWHQSSSYKLIAAMQNEPLQFREYKTISNDLKQLLIGMLHIDASKRIGWQDLFQHKLFNKEPFLDELETTQISMLDSMTKSMAFQYGYEKQGVNISDELTDFINLTSTKPSKKEQEEI